MLTQVGSRPGRMLMGSFLRSPLEPKRLLKFPELLLNVDDFFADFPEYNVDPGGELQPLYSRYYGRYSRHYARFTAAIMGDTASTTHFRQFLR